MLVVNVGKNKGRPGTQYNTSEILTDKIEQLIDPKLNHFLDIKLKNITESDFYKNIKIPDQRHDFLAVLLSLAEHLEHVIAPIDNKNNFTDDFLAGFFEKRNTLRYHCDLDYIITRLESYDVSFLDIILEKLEFLSFPAIRELKFFLVREYDRLNLNDSLTVGENKHSVRHSV